MSQTIGWTSTIKVSGGPEMVISRSVNVEALGLIQVEIEASATNKKVEVQPGEEGLKFLAITSDWYEELSYKVNSDGADAKTVTLDAPQVLIGDGAIKLLDDAPRDLFFTNESDHRATVQILVGRDATPPPPATPPPAEE